jgi:hypothetical protein
MAHLRTDKLPDDRCRHICVEAKGRQQDAARSKVKADSQPVYRIKPNRALPKRSKHAAK